MNKKGFAISGLVYGILIIFLLLVFSSLGILVGRKNSLDKIKENAIDVISGKDIINKIDSMPYLVADFNTVYVNKEAKDLGIDYFKIGVSSPFNYDINYSTSFTFGSNTKYDIIYKALDINNNEVSSITKNVEEKNDDIKNFPFTGDKEELIIGPGIFKLEAWGAESGSPSSSKGSYASGYLVLDTKTRIYVYVGGKGYDKLSTNTRNPGGYNGGEETTGGESGGGASDIRIGSDNINARVIVANGGNGVNRGGSFFGNTSSFTWEEKNKNVVTGINNWLLDSKYYLINTSTYNGANTMVSPSGTSEVGHSGNGYVRITSILSFK